MDLVVLVAALALAEYGVFVLLTGQARGRAGVAAPATVGDPRYERFFRVQMNTIEQLVIFLPSLAMFAHYVSEPVAAALGGVFIVGRALYARAYVTDPASRGPGFGLTLLANTVLLSGGLIGAATRLL